MTTKFSSKGFTLIELLVVMAIIGILMGLVVPKVGRMMDEAKENKCRDNLRQLQVAVMSHATDKDGALPYAMSYEVYDAPNRLYYERRGWIAWYPPSGDPNELRTLWTHTNDEGKTVSGANTSQESKLVEDLGFGKEALFGVENGTLYEYMNKSLEHYLCPFIKNSSTNKTLVAYRTYAMSGFFQSSETRGSNPRFISKVATAEEYNSYKPESAKLLLFSEINPSQGTCKIGLPSSGTAAPQNPADCCFAPNSKTFTPTVDQIHTVHRSGTPGVKAAFAVFLDGHIEKVFSSVTVGSEKRNTVWYYNRGLDPTGSN